MATTTASILLNSPDIMSSQTVNISKSSSLKQAGKRTIGVESTTGLAMKTLEQITAATIIDYSADDITGSAAKIYVRNTSSSTTQYLVVKIGAQIIGRLYGGDFMFIPYTGGDSADITVTPSTSAKVIVEYIAFY